MGNKYVVTANRWWLVVVWILAVALSTRAQTASSTLTLTQPTYNCQTGAITFNTTGGDGSLITYNAPGITRSSLTSNTGTIEQGLRNDPKTINLTATQNGQTVSYTFDFGAFCRNPVSRHPDLDPLIDLYNATNGPGWTNNTNWLQGSSPCNWWGVSCDGSGRVTQVQLGGNKLDGSLPASLGNLTKLSRLYLVVNQLRGPIPASLGNLTQMKDLFLHTNQLSGSIPANLGNLADLRNLSLSFNELSGEIPANLGNLTRLTHIDLGKNQLTGSLPHSLGNLPELSDLYLSNNQFSGSIPANLGNLPKLLNLNLVGNQLSGCFPAALSALCGKDVRISGNAGLPGGGDFASFCANRTGACRTGTEGTLALIEPTYDCATGAITFITNGGDGSLITYNAPGITRSSLTSNTGIVERELRNDPKPITITATQSGNVANYTFSIQALCNRQFVPLAPVVVNPIPDQTLTVGAEISVYVDQYFRDPTVPPSAHYRSHLHFTGRGLPPGLLFYDRSQERLPIGFYAGIPTTPGTYTVTVIATSLNASPPNNFVSTTFKITVVDKSVVNPTPPPTGGTLTMTQPTYDCRTGDIAFNTTGGDGSPITYNAPGISRISPTTNTGIIELGLRNDPKPITITATQSSQTASYTFDFGTFCRVPSTPQPPVLVRPIASQTLTVGRTVPAQSIDIGSAFFDPTVITGTYKYAWSMQINGIPNGLTLNGNDQNLSIASPRLFMVGTPTTPGVYTLTIIARTDALPNQPVTTTFTLTIVNVSASNALALTQPAYNCQSGAFTFNTTGGDGSSIEYASAGITGWTTNPNQFVDKDSRTVNDIKPFTLMARQNGVTVSLVWDLKAACGRARLGVGEGVAALRLTLLGNPVSDAATVEVRGAEGQRLSLRLMDLGGRLVESRLIEQAGSVERQRFDLPRSGVGMWLLRVSSGTQSQTVKIVKQ